MADQNGRAIHGPSVTPTREPPPTDLCPACSEPHHAPRRCEYPEVRVLKRRVRELEAELRHVRAEVAEEKSKAAR